MTKESPARRSGACSKLAVQRSGVVSGRGLLPPGGHHLEHGLNAHLLVLDFFSERAAENIGDPITFVCSWFMSLNGGLRLSRRPAGSFIFAWFTSHLDY